MIELLCGLKGPGEDKAIFLKKIKWEKCKKKMRACPKPSMRGILGASCIKEIKGAE